MDGLRSGFPAARKDRRAPDAPDSHRQGFSNGDAAATRVAFAQGWGSEEHLAGLVRTIEGEIIPRLMLAHRDSAAPARRPGEEPAEPTAEDVAEFAGLVLRGEAEAMGFLGEARARGVPWDAILLHLLAPTARRLGDLWVEDLCDFTDVTVGLCRLHEILHEITASSDRTVEPRGDAHRVLLVPAPGEQHSFGLIMVVEFFRRAGWDVWGEPSLSSRDLSNLVRAQWFELVGLSTSCDNRLEQLTQEIRTIRAKSCNPDVVVMVGGRVFCERPELAEAVGADATAMDGRDAAIKAETLLEAVTPRRR